MFLVRCSYSVSTFDEGISYFQFIWLWLKYLRMMCVLFYLDLMRNKYQKDVENGDLKKKLEVRRRWL